MPILCRMSCRCLSWCVRCIYQDKCNKILGHTLVNLIKIGDQKGITVTNIVVTENFLSPILWWLKIFCHHLLVCHYGLAIYIKKYLGQKKNYGEFNISPWKNPLKGTKLLQNITTLSLIPSLNISQNIIFQKSSYKNRPTTWGSKSLKLL
jgi:hypothetical protein